jgi:uncharacterized repeat protein (TIGR01451 family)
MKLSTLIATRRKRFRRSASPFFKLGIENLEGRLVMASILPVSVADPAGSSPVTANGPSEQGSISGDGRYVVYLSNAANLVAGQTDTIVEGNNYKDVFLYDSVTKTTKLVSGSGGSATKTADHESLGAVISANGRYIAFTSHAQDVVPGQVASDSNQLNLFLYNVQTGTTTLVSHASGSTITPANGTVLEGSPAISADGRRIAFISGASDMISGITDDPGTYDVFLFDRGDNTTPASMKLVSRSATLPATATGSFFVEQVALSADGNYVAFQSASTDLVTDQNDSNGHADIFLFNAIDDKVRLVSSAAGSTTIAANGPSFQAAPLAISAHGRYVAFRSFATDLVEGQIDMNFNSDVFLFDRDAATSQDRLRLISHAHDSAVTAATGSTAASEIPVVNVDLANDESSGDGLVIAYQSTATNLAAGVSDNGTSRDLFLYDVATGRSTLLTHNAASQNAPASTLLDYAVDNQPGRTPVISSNGKFIAYSSPATDLVPNQVDSVLLITNDVFRYEVKTKLNSLMSGNGGSIAQTGDSHSAVSGITADGSNVVFSSESTDLIEGDGNLSQDVLLSFLSVPPPPQPDLKVNISDTPDPVRRFRESVHSVTVRNDGDGPATNVQVASDRLPTGVSYADGDSSVGCDMVGTRVICTLGTIAVGSEKSVDIAYLLNVSGVVTLGATASATETDLSPVDNTASETTRVVDDLQLTLTDSPDPIHVGEDLMYEFRVTNPNLTPASSVMISSPLPDNVTFVSVSTNLCNVAANVFTCNIGQLDPSQSLPLRYVVRPHQPGTLVNLGGVVRDSGVDVGGVQSITTTVRPANDDFAKRQVLSGAQGSVVSASNRNATGESLLITGATETSPVDPQQVTKSVWYQWTPTFAAGNYGQVDFFTAGSSFDTLLTVYTKLFDGSLKVLTHNDDVPIAGDRTSRVSFSARSGVKFFIAVDGYHGAEGDITLAWTQGAELQPGPVQQIVERLNPAQVNAGTGPELITVRGTGFSSQSVGFVNGQQRPTAVIAEGNDLVLAVGLTAEDKAFPGSAQISVRTGDAVSEVNQKSTLLIGNYETVTVVAGESGTGRTRTLLGAGKPQPFTEWKTTCDPQSTGGHCVSTLVVYLAPTGQFCDRNELCFPTLRQYQIAHGLYCDDFACSTSLDGYKRSHNGQFPTDPAMPGAVVADSAYSVQLTGTVQLGSLMLGTGAAIPDGAMLIGQDGASLIGQDGASLLDGLRAAGLIGQDGASLIGQDGASVVANDGAGLVNRGNGEGEPSPAIQPSGWFILRDSNGNPATMTNTSNLDGTTSGTGSLELDAATLAKLSNGMIFAIVVPDKLEFSADSYTVAENRGEALITVTRTGTSVGRVTVQYSTEDDTATAGEDYTATSGTLTFESGEMSKTFTIPILTDTTTESEEKIKLILSMPGGIVRLGPQTTSLVSITPPAFPWQNPRDRLDVNGDMSVSPIDVLQIVNELNMPMFAGQNGLLPAPPSSGVPSFYDVSGDGVVSPIDALLIVNFLNTGVRPSPEGTDQLAETDASSWLLSNPVTSALPPAPCPSLGTCDQVRMFSNSDRALKADTMSSKDVSGNSHRDAIFARWADSTSTSQRDNFVRPTDNRMDARHGRNPMRHSEEFTALEDVLTRDAGARPLGQDA